MQSTSGSDIFSCETTMTLRRRITRRTWKKKKVSARQDMESVWNKMILRYETMTRKWIQSKKYLYVLCFPSSLIPLTSAFHFHRLSTSWTFLHSLSLSFSFSLMLHPLTSSSLYFTPKTDRKVKTYPVFTWKQVGAKIRHNFARMEIDCKKVFVTDRRCN